MSFVVDNHCAISKVEYFKLGDILSYVGGVFTFFVSLFGFFGAFIFSMFLSQVAGYIRKNHRADRYSSEEEIIKKLISRLSYFRFYLMFDNLKVLQDQVDALKELVE